MMNNSEFILLHTTKYGENSIILHTLSREYGRKGFFIKSMPRRSATSLFFPLSILEADIFETNKSRLFTARNVASRYSLTGIRNSIGKSAITMFVSEVLYRVIKDGMQDAALYDMCVRNILLLDAMESDFSNFHLYFLLEFIISLGFSPELHDLEPFLDERLPLAADFELMLRLFECHHIVAKHLDMAMIRMRLGGATSKDYTNIVKNTKECMAAFRKNGLKPPVLYPAYRLLPKLLQYVK